MRGLPRRTKVLITGGSSGIGEATALAMVAEGAAVARRRPAQGAPRRSRRAHRGRRRNRCRDRGRHHRRGSGEGPRRGRARGARRARLPRQQRRRDAARASAGRRPGRVAPDDRGQLPRAPLLHPLRAAADARRRRRGRRQRLVGRGTDRERSAAAVYNMTKWGVVGYSEALRQEGAHIGVRVTCVEPGFVETELQGHNTNPIVVEQIDKMMEATGKVARGRRHRQRDRLRRLAAEARERQRDPRAAHAARAR